jgi:hypothetical protein
MAFAKKPRHLESRQFLGHRFPENDGGKAVNGGDVKSTYPISTAANHRVEEADNVVNTELYPHPTPQSTFRSGWCILINSLCNHTGEKVKFQPP